MDRNRYRTILEAYGADPARWPSGEREAALRLASTDPMARQLLDEAREADREIENALDFLPEFTPSAALRDTVLAAAPRAVVTAFATGPAPASAGMGLRELLWPFGPLWRPAVGFAASAMLGVIFGAYVPDPWAGERLSAAAEPVDYDLTVLAFNAEEPLLPFEVTNSSVIAGRSGVPAAGPASENIPAVATRDTFSPNPVDEGAPNLLAEGVVPTPKPTQKATIAEISDAESPTNASAPALSVVPDSAMPPPAWQAETSGDALANDTVLESLEDDVVVTYGPEEAEPDFEDGLLGFGAGDRGIGFGPADMGLGFSGEFERGGWRK